MWYVCDVVLVSYVVGAVVAVIIMRMMLFVLGVSMVSMVRRCEGDGNAGVGTWR